MGYASSGTVRGTGTPAVDGLLSGTRWTGGALTYGSPTSAADYGSGYHSDQNFDGVSAPRQGFSTLTATQLGAIRGILDADGVGCRPAHAGFTVEGFTNLSITYARDADIRYANSSDAPTAYAYQPGAGIGGDVWLGRSGQKPIDGYYDMFTLIHETGHALGLKHPHERGGLGTTPSALDCVEFSAVSYKTHVGSTPTGYHFEKGGTPQSFMMLDIAALQHMYGADFTTNAGATTYSWTPDSGTTCVNGQAAITPGLNRIFATIWDGGGTDTYDLSAYDTDLKIDLRPGEASAFSARQLVDLDGTEARGNIYNALLYLGDTRSLIENATGGDGNDLITGNTAKNTLTGGAGNDILCGGANADTLIGEAGRDVFRFATASDSQPGACDRILGFDGAGAARGDTIDLRMIDADATRPGDQAFVFGTSHGRGHLWLETVGTQTHVLGNIDNDRGVEFDIAILDGNRAHTAYSASDFLL